MDERFRDTGQLESHDFWRHFRRRVARRVLDIGQSSYQTDGI